MKSAPGPRGAFLLGSLPAARRDPLKMITDAVRDHGDVVRLTFGPTAVHLVRHPDQMKAVLQDPAVFSKQTRGFDNIRLLIPGGLLTSEGAFWLQQRRIAQPAFHKQRIAGFMTTMARAAEATVDGWRDGAEIDLFEEMMRLTLRNVGETLLGVDARSHAETVAAAFDEVLRFIRDRALAPVPIPASWPTPANRRFRRARAELDAVVYGLIAQRRATPGEDLLSLLLEARDEDTGTSMSDLQLHDEVLTMFLAGHETTATALAWTLWLVARAPQVREQLEAGPEGAFSRQVVDEALRLYPPVWMIPRRAEIETGLGGYRIPSRSLVLLSIYALHRHPQLWERPDQFDPSRFRTPPPRWSYLPFGGGPHQCIGNAFALAELQLVLAAVTRRFRLEALDDGVEPQPLVTLRPRGGIRVRLHKR